MAKNYQTIINIEDEATCAICLETPMVNPEEVCLSTNQQKTKHFVYIYFFRLTLANIGFAKIAWLKFWGAAIHWSPHVLYVGQSWRIDSNRSIQLCFKNINKTTLFTHRISLFVACRHTYQQSGAFQESHLEQWGYFTWDTRQQRWCRGCWPALRSKIQIRGNNIKANLIELFVYPICLRFRRDLAKIVQIF